MLRSLFLFQLLIAALGTCAQVAAPEIQAVNERFAGSVQVKLDRRERLVFDFFDASGRFRQDVVPAELLDAEQLHYSPEENAIILVCKSTAAQCITKEIFKMNTIRSTGRSNLPIPAGDIDGAGTIQDLGALIRKVQEHMNSLSETRQAP